MPDIAWTDWIVPNGGIDETLHPQKLDPRKWTSATDVEPLPDGVRRRLGSATFGGVLPAAVTAIMDYRKADGTTAVHLAFAAGRIYAPPSTSAISGAFTGALTYGDDVLPSWTVGADRLFLTNNVEVAKKFYRISTTNYWENDGTAAPTATITLETTGSGATLPTATWHVDYYYWNADLGIASDRRYGGVSTPSQAITVGQELSITGLPAAVVRTGDRATHIRIEARQSTETYRSHIRLVRRSIWHWLSRCSRHKVHCKNAQFEQTPCAT